VAGYYMSAKATEIGSPGDERQKFISKYQTGQALLWTGLALGTAMLTVALWSNVRGQKLKNERARRVAGGVGPMIGGAAASMEVKF
jgi:hypothetical protein